MLALRACLEELEASLDGEVDGLIVAQFEVQVAPPLYGSPVAAEERAVLEEEERPGRGVAGFIAREDEQGSVSHGPEDLIEERPVEVGDAPLAVKRGEVEPVHKRGVLGEERVPRKV